MEGVGGGMVVYIRVLFDVSTYFPKVLIWSKMAKDSLIAFERLLLVMIEIFDQFQTIETLK